MALIGPILDDRSFEDLRAELLRRIPVYTREWTNHNESDPGVTLLELFAFLGESLLFRFNQIPDATRVAFLRLLGIDPHPATPARVLVAAGTERAEGVQIPPGAELRAGDVRFETENEVYVWPVTALAAGKTPAPAVDSTGVSEPGTSPRGGVPDARTRYELERRRHAARDLPVDDVAEVSFYETTLLPAEPDPDGDALDVGATLDRALWVALLGGPTTKTSHLRGKTIFLGIATDDRIDPPFVLDADGLDESESGRYRATGLADDPPGMLWRLWQGPAPADPQAGQRGQAGQGPAAARDVFVPLTVLRDTTRGLTRTGVVQLELPASIDTVPGSDGGTDNPPPLDDPAQFAALFAWLQVTRPDGENDGIGRIRWVGANAVEADQASTAQLELLGTGTGDADQRLPLAQRGVLRRTVELEVEEPDGWRAWEEVDEFTASARDDRARDDRHFTVDLAAGVVRFGRYCRVPQIGERVRVRSYRYGGGSRGRVTAGAVKSVTGVAGVTVTNPLPADGGDDAEPLTDALDRIPGELHRRDRAVTAEDYRDLTLQLTGVARAETLDLLHPDAPNVAAAGVVSVVVFPDSDPNSPGAPRPDQALLRRVAAHLDPRRLATTELYVLPPTYVRVAVAAGVVVRDGYQVDAVRRWVELILRQFLAPLPPFGPDGRGWPLGRTIRRAELEAVAVQVEGVEYLAGLRLAVEDGTSWPTVGEVALRRWQVPEVAELTVVKGQPLEPGASYQPAPPGGLSGGPSGGPPEAVIAPLPREVC